MTCERRDQQQAQQARDGALRRIVRTRTAAIAGSAGLTAGLAVLVADTAPGKTYHRVRIPVPATAAPSAHPTRAAALAAAPMPPLASARALGLRPPGAPPSAAPANPTATSATATSPAPPPTATQPGPAASPAPAGPVVSGGS